LCHGRVHYCRSPPSTALVATASYNARVRTGAMCNNRHVNMHCAVSSDHSLRWEPGEVIARHVSVSEAMHTQWPQAALRPCAKRGLESVLRVPHHISWAHAMYM
jgi:hypothetical protein